MFDFIKTIVDKFDRSRGFFVKHKRWFLLGVAVILLGCFYWKGKKVYTSRVDTKSIETTVKYLISSSARHVESAVNLSSKNPIEAFEHAVYGASLASTAKDLIDDKTEFSKTLNVDVYKYLDYTNQVLTQIKQSLK